MNLTKQVGLFGGALALSLTGGAFAGGEELNNDELKSRLLAAEAKIAELEAQNNDNWLTEQRSDEIRSLVNDVLADADTRASLLQSGMTAGYDDGFVISSSDGNWLLRVNGQLQARFVYSRLDEESDGSNGGDRDKYGFENTRTRLMFSGHVVNPSITYMIDAAVFGSQDEFLTAVNNDPTTEGDFELKDAWVRWDYGNGWGVKFGQFRVPINREFEVFSGHQLAVERSNVSYAFGGRRTQGVMVEYEADAFKAMGSFNDGANTLNTPYSAYDTEYAFTGRLYWLAAGTWDQMKDFTSPAGDETGLLIGGAIHYQKDEFGTSATGVGNPPGTAPDDNEFETLILTVDAQAEFGGFNLFGAFSYASVDPNDGDSVDTYGFIIQGGWNLSDDWELFGRFEYADFDLTGVPDNLGILTFGVNRYFSGHNLKWTTDFQWAIEEAIAANPITGIRPTGEKDQFAIRTQLQLMF